MRGETRLVQHAHVENQPHPRNRKGLFTIFVVSLTDEDMTTNKGSETESMIALWQARGFAMERVRCQVERVLSCFQRLCSRIFALNRTISDDSDFESPATLYRDDAQE